MKDPLITILLYSFAFCMGAIFALNYKQPTECRSDAIASIESKEGLSCVYQEAQWGIARRVEK